MEYYDGIQPTEFTNDTFGYIVKDLVKQVKDLGIINDVVMEKTEELVDSAQKTVDKAQTTIPFLTWSLIGIALISLLLLILVSVLLYKMNKISNCDKHLVNSSDSKND